MSYQLEKDLSAIETSIRDAILSGDNFQYQKLLRMKAENLDSQFFNTTRQLKDELQNLTESRKAAIAQKSELENALTSAANDVLAARGRLFDAEQEYQRIGNFIFYAETQIEQQRKDIRDLQKRLDSHVNSKLSGGNSPEMETLTNETTY